jgi:hypothetical protein
MPEDRISMSQRERDVLKVMAGVLKGERTVVEAARLLRRSVRQVRRIRRRLEAEGDRGVIHRLRSRASNRRCDPAHRAGLLSAYREEYLGFGPTLAAEKLAERGLTIGVETLRRWLLAEGLWQRRRRRDVHRTRRPRRECFGELVQMDTSIHDWLEGRGEAPVLTAMIDDATGKIAARFYPAETTVDHMDLLRRWLRQRGRPVALYTDRDSIYRVEGKLDPDKPIQTQFSRALAELGIELILANSPQAKGRVERLFGTLQDRWVKELRLAKVTTLAQANALLESKLLPHFNRWFTVKPASPNDAHRPLQPAHDLDAILSLQTTRSVANDYTLRFENAVYQLLPPAWPGLRGGKVIVERRADGTLRIRFRQRYLPFEQVQKCTAEKQSSAPAASLGGSAPQTPRSLALSGPPADGKGRRSRKPRPSAGKTTARRSGRTPALPYPPNGKACGSGPDAWRPVPQHPWRKAVREKRTFLSG